MITLIFAAVSCTKVIDVDLNKTDPKYVIEGTILNNTTTQKVRITRTLNFDESTAFPVVDNAVVTVTDNLGVSGTFVSVGDGYYELLGYQGIEGRTYNLTVTVDGKTFTASSTMPQLVTIDSLYYTEFVFVQDTFRSPVAAHFDPAGIQNYYQFHITRNGNKEEGVYLLDDQFTDGNLDVQPLFIDSLEIGDQLTVDMFCIDKPVWTYFNQLSVNTNGQGATPANPTSNISGGCLGYFSARTVDSKTIIVQ